LKHFQSIRPLCMLQL